LALFTSNPAVFQHLELGAQSTTPLDMAIK
jgi:hypothetical protein